MQVVGDVELGRYVGVFAVAHALSVHPKVEAVTHAVEAHVDVVASQTVGCDVEVAAIGTHRVRHIAVVGEPSRPVSHHAVGRLVKREGVGHVAVERLVPRLSVVHSPHLPAGRYVDAGPGCVVIVG